MTPSPHPREAPLKLADAQFVIARECGFPSWPRLKAHTESLDASRRLVAERLTLEVVRDHGPLPVGKAFAYLMRDYEPLPYLGDLMFCWLLQPLIAAPRPALEIGETHREWPHRRLVLTELGRDLLAEGRNWLDYAPGERWVGGIRIPLR